MTINLTNKGRAQELFLKVINSLIFIHITLIFCREIFPWSNARKRIIMTRIAL